MKSFFAIAAAAAFACSVQSANAQTRGYYQTPSLGDEALVFSSEGDLWRAAVTGGTATRLTTHSETEVSPKLSPSGERVAFDASYDGPGEIYIMPVTGGTPQRVTFEGGGVSVRGWLDDDTLIYRSTNVPGTIPMVLRTVTLSTGEVSDIPLADMDQAALSEDGQTLFFTRYGLSLFNDNAIMYRGGRMAQLWRYELGSDAEATRLAADFGAPIRNPMVWQGRVYFISDKSGADNIWSMSGDGGDIRQHTASETGLMKTPDLHNGQIIYQSGADLFLYDIEDDATEMLSLFLMSDSDYKRPRWLPSPLQYLESAQIAPAGKSVTLTARGRFVRAFTRDRRRIEFTVPDGYRARYAVISGNNEWVYAILDGGTRGEIWRFNVDGLDDGEPVTDGSDSYIWAIYPVPESGDFLYSDKRGRLFYHDTEAGRSREVDRTESSNDLAFGEFNWSPDQRYVAYTMYDGRDLSQITLLDTDTNEKTLLTSGKYESFAPAFSRDGDWLYFISNRNFNASPGSPWGDRNLGPAFSERGKIYALQLDPEAEFPFRHRDELALRSEDDDDEDEDTSEDEEADDESSNTDASDDEAVNIEFDGLTSRLWEVPVDAGDYVGLTASHGHLLVLVDEGRENALKRIKFTASDPELSGFANDVRRFNLSADGKTLFVQHDDSTSARFYLVNPDKSFPSDKSDVRVRASDWKLRVTPSEEWRQMAEDAWRLHRDFAFDPGLRDVDWDAVGERFLPLATRIGHRTELNDLLSQMSAELGILHSQIRQGDTPSDDESGQPAFLGATYTPVANGLRVDLIYKGEADRPDTLGPLRSQGVDIAEGDVITAIDGRDVRSYADLTRALAMKSGDQILVDYERNGNVMQEIVVPVSARTESVLQYAHWVEQNRRAVADATDGEFGYLHLRAMGSSDLESFARDFYEHFDKDGVIIDVRGNRGGNVDSFIIASLLRRAWAFWQGIEGGPVFTNMQQAFRGHLVVLIDEGTYSDGETFSAGVKALELGPLIGTRTAGAGIWLSDRNPLADRGQARVAEFAQFGMDGRWLIEGYGVAPDMQVENLPYATYQGQDAQLNAAIGYLRDKVASDPIPELVPGPIPPVGEPGRDVR
tara:strand:- start:3022 stop:6336 length:3315 start_codon:yes stop_codon:yes gene_type:complete